MVHSLSRRMHCVCWGKTPGGLGIVVDVIVCLFPTLKPRVACFGLAPDGFMPPPSLGPLIPADKMTPEVLSMFMKPFNETASSDSLKSGGEDLQKAEVREKRKADAKAKAAAKHKERMEVLRAAAQAKGKTFCSKVF